MDFLSSLWLALLEMFAPDRAHEFRMKWYEREDAKMAAYRERALARGIGPLDPNYPRYKSLK